MGLGRLDGCKNIAAVRRHARIDALLRDYSPARIVILDNMVRGTIWEREQALKDARVTLVRGDIRDAATVSHGDGRHRCRHPHGSPAHYGVCRRSARGHGE